MYENNLPSAGKYQYMYINAHSTAEEDGSTSYPSNMHMFNFQQCMHFQRWGFQMRLLSGNSIFTIRSLWNAVLPNMP
jgi:hypothetical protein